MQKSHLLGKFHILLPLAIFRPPILSAEQGGKRGKIIIIFIMKLREDKLIKYTRVALI